MRIGDNLVSRRTIEMRRRFQISRCVANPEHDQVRVAFLRRLKNAVGGLAMFDNRFGPAPLLNFFGDQFVKLVQGLRHRQLPVMIYMPLAQFSDYVEENEPRLIFFSER
jgi:hypothetical protein